MFLKKKIGRSAKINKNTIQIWYKKLIEKGESETESLNRNSDLENLTGNWLLAKGLRNHTKLFNSRQS
jgi:hypothetical protein